MKRFRKIFFISFFLIAVCIFCGCTTLPNVSNIMEDVPAGERPPEIVGAKGTVSEQTSKKIIERIKRFSGASDIMEKQTLAAPTGPYGTGYLNLRQRSGEETLVSRCRA